MGKKKIYGFSLWELGGASTIALLFVLAGYLSMRYMNTLEQTIGSLGVWGMGIYVLISIFATVIAPISATPLVPVAATVWGPFVTSILNITAWTSGSVLAFLFARKYGYNVVAKFVRLHKIQQYIEKIPDQKLFSTVLLVRLTVPADVLSYALGLFSKMRIVPYTVATLLGVTPFAFVLSYTVTFPLQYQIFILLLIGILLFFSYRNYYRKGQQPVSTENETTQ